MKQIFFVSFLVLTCITLGFRPFDPGKNDLASENLKGMVKKVTTSIYVAAGYGATSVKSISNYNIQGNITESYFYDISRGEKLFLGWIYAYDAQGRKTGISNNSEEVISTSVYSYNLTNNLTETIYMGKHAAFYITYNHKGDRDSMLYYDRAGRLNGSVIYVYDEGGNLTEKNWYNPDGVSDYKMLYKYDSNHNKLQETRYTSKGKDSWTAFKYDDKGNVIMQIDSNIIRIRGAGGSIPAHNISLNSNARTFSYARFDKTGNWLEKQEIVNEAVVSVTKREIEYY